MHFQTDSIFGIFRCHTSALPTQCVRLVTQKTTAVSLPQSLPYRLQIVFPIASTRTPQKTSTSKTQIPRMSRKSLFLATLSILLFLWRAGKIVFWKRSKEEGVSHGVAVDGTKSLQVSRLRFQFKSTWRLLWKQNPLGKAEKRDWRVFMKLKQVYRRMSNQFLFNSKVTKHLWKMGSWQRHLRDTLEKKSKSVELERRECRGGDWKMSGRGFPFVHSCLQKLKMLKISRRSVSWGELVQSRDDRHQAVLKKYNTRLQLYRKMPLKQLSQLWGQFNQLELPVWLRSPAIRLYIWMFNCCLDEADIQDLKQYPNVGEFFQRRLRPGVRPINSQPLTSPCDGTVLHCGLVRGSTLEQVKGVTYSLEGFLGPPNEDLYNSKDQGPSFDGKDVDLDYGRHLLTDSVNNRLFQCIIYLAPGDYHRFHSPANWVVSARRHFPGELFSVNPSIARWLQGLFCLNERVVYNGRWKHGFMSMSPVGATNVGSITVYHDQDLLTNVERTWRRGCYYDKSFSSDSSSSSRTSGVMMKKGDAFGHFSLGSTIVLLFEAPSSFRLSIQPGQKVKYGQGIGECAKQNLRRRITTHLAKKTGRRKI